MRTEVLAIALLLTPLAAAQAFAPTGTLTFEVASIKPSAPGEEYVGIHPTPGGQRYIAAKSPLKDFLYVAYQVKPEQITGGPAWVATELYDLNAEAEHPSSIEDLHIMLQNLMTERFKLRFHFESKEMPAYVLTVDQSVKGGPKNLKLHPNASGGDVHLDRTTYESRPEVWTARCASMNFFIWRLAAWFDRPFINQTNLDGCFEFELTFEREQPLAVSPAPGTPQNAAPIEASGPTIFEALQKQLGLKLESKKGPVATMVIDHAEKPSEN